jgi:FkbM family methyltransferase
MVMRLYKKSKLRLKQLLGHEITNRIELDCKAFDVGDWAFSPIGISSSSVIVSVGIANDISFDKGLINSFACHVHAFDPTPGRIDWIRAKRMPPEFHFHPYAIGEKNGTLCISSHAPINGRYSSPVLLMTDKMTNDGKSIEVPVKKISTVMSEIGVDHIDILKMDMEAAEYAIIEDILDSGIKVYQLLVEFHHRFKTVPIEKTKSVLEKLSAAGYRIFHISEKYREFSLIHEETYYQHVNETLKGLKLTPRNAPDAPDRRHVQNGRLHKQGAMIKTA